MTINKTASDEITALWHENESSSVLRQVRTPPADLIAITSRYSMISSGTERLVAAGDLDADLAHKMSVQHQEGGFSLPVKYGYSLVGHTQEQELVHLMHPHQSVAFAEPEQLFYVPEGVEADVAALISNMETVLNAIWDSELFFANHELRSKRIAVVGFGNIGALLALSLKKMCGVQPVIIETNAWRRQKARSLGFSVLNDNHNESFELLFHSTGKEAGLRHCLRLAAMEGVILDLSWYGTSEISLPMGREFHYQRLRLISSQVSQIPKHKHQESYQSRKQRCAELLLDPQYQTLISDKIPFVHSPDFFARLRSNQLPNGLIWLLDYSNSETEPEAKKHPKPAINPRPENNPTPGNHNVQC